MLFQPLPQHISVLTASAIYCLLFEWTNAQQALVVSFQDEYQGTFRSSPIINVYFDCGCTHQLLSSVLFHTPPLQCTTLAGMSSIFPDGLADLDSIPGQRSHWSVLLHSDRYFSICSDVICPSPFHSTLRSTRSSHFHNSGYFSINTSAAQSPTTTSWYYLALMTPTVRYSAAQIHVAQIPIVQPLPQLVHLDFISELMSSQSALLYHSQCSSG
jgi:hypothetical protein